LAQAILLKRGSECVVVYMSMAPQSLDVGSAFPSSASSQSGEGIPLQTRTPPTSPPNICSGVLTHLKGSLAALGEKPAALVQRKAFRQTPTSASQLEADIFREKKGELDDFEAFLEAAADCADAIRQAASLLERAPVRLVEEARRLHNSSGGSGASGGGLEKVQRLERVFGNLASQIRGAEPHLDSLQKLANQTRKRMTEAKAAIARRDEAWARKNYYDGKVEMLLKSADRSKSDEKLMRNIGKQQASHREHLQLEDQALMGAGDLISNQWPLAAAMLSGLCAYHAAVFQDAQHLSNAFKGFVDQFRTPQLWGATQQAADSALPTSRVGGCGPRSSHGSAKTSMEQPATTPAVASSRGGVRSVRISLESSRPAPPSSGLSTWEPAAAAAPLPPSPPKACRERSTGSTGSWLRQLRDAPMRTS